MRILNRIDKILDEFQVKEEGESGATVVANVEKNPAAATNMVRRQQCPPGQRWCPTKETCVPDPRVSEGIIKIYKQKKSSGIESEIELVRSVAKDQGVDDYISDAEAKKIIRDVKSRGGKEDFYYNLKEYFYT